MALMNGSWLYPDYTWPKYSKVELPNKYSKSGALDWLCQFSSITSREKKENLQMRLERCMIALTAVDTME